MRILSLQWGRGKGEQDINFWLSFRVIELFGLEGIFKRHLVQPPPPQ